MSQFNAFRMEYFRFSCRNEFSLITYFTFCSRKIITPVCKAQITMFNTINIAGNNQLVQIIIYLIRWERSETRQNYKSDMI